MLRLKNNLLAIFLMFFLSNHCFSQETIKTMFYNILDFPEAPPSNRADLLKIIIDNYQPDLFMICELQSEEGANTILNTSLRTNDDRYMRADFVSNQSNTNSDLQQMVFYNSKKMILESQNEIVTSVRDINHYIFKLNTQETTTNAVYLDVFVAHLKSSQGFENEQLRLEMALDFTSSLGLIPTDHYVIFAGDFNFYSSNEPGYEELLDPTNSIVLVDPINRSGNWHTNTTFQDIHTQSTRTSNSGFDGFGAGGGLDDRFDFILISENLQTSTTLKYIESTYGAYGNNGNCFNNNINDANCSGPDYTQPIRDVLYNMSDHLPVVMQLQTDKVLNQQENYYSNTFMQITNGNIITDDIFLEIDPIYLNKRLIIYDGLGQKLKIILLSETRNIIDATNLSSGIYYLTMEQSSQIKPLKIIKL